VIICDFSVGVFGGRYINIGDRPEC
jgi:hypothetical protein